MTNFCAMLDMSRNGVMTEKEVINFAKIIKSFGYNRLMLYTEDTYEVENEPYFGYMRGRYTTGELQKIVNECGSFGIEVIPCIQTLAHLQQIFRWNKYLKIRDIDGILLAQDEKTYLLIENMFKTLRKIYKTNYIHIGMDEAHYLGLGKYLQLHGYQDRFTILNEHLKRIVGICKKYDFTPIMWSDMFFKLSNDGEYYPQNPIIDEKTIKLTPKEVGLVYWDYYHYEQEHYDKMIKAHQKFDNEIWFAAGAWTWTGFTPGNYHTLETACPAMIACKNNNINNIIMTLWGDDGKECSYYSILPSLFAVKKYYDGERDEEKIKQEFYQLTNENFEDMIHLDLANWIDGNKASARNPSKYMFYSDIFSGYLDTTVRECGVEEYKKYTTMLKNAGKKSKSYSYLYQTQSALCDVLSLKYDYGVRLRKAYNDKNNIVLKELSSELSTIIQKVEIFYQKLSYQWYKENKPQGFEVQDIRIGGLILRLKACKARLDSFINGELKKIDELEGELLCYYGNENEKPLDELPGFNKWTNIASLNNL